MNKKIAHLVIGITVTLVSIWLVFRSVSIAQVVEALREPNYWWLIPNLSFGLLAMIFQAVRWRLLISPLKRIPVTQVFTATSIGLLINNILPLRLGEYARIFVLSRRDNDLSTPPLLATVLVERVVFDLGFLALLLLIVSLFVPLHREIEIGRSAFVVITLLAILLALVIMTAVMPRVILKAVSRLLPFVPARRRPSIGKLMNQFFEMMLRLGKRDVLLQGVVLSGVIWGCMAMSIYFLFISFSLHLPLPAAFVLLAALTLAMFIPSLPGYIGVFHLAAVLTLSAYNIGDVDARAFAIVLHLAQYVPTTVIGLIFLHRISLSLGQIRNKAMDGKLPESSPGA